MSSPHGWGESCWGAWLHLCTDGFAGCAVFGTFLYAYTQYEELDGNPLQETSNGFTGA